jgi:curved DNA-binding protein CbpA
MDPYAELGLAPTASDDEVTSAYRRDVKIHHPDAGGERSRFDSVKRAYDVLRDPARRRRYDETGTVDESPASLLERNALSAAREALMAVALGDQDPLHVDVVGAALAGLEGKAAALRARAAAIAVKLTRLEQVRSRITAAAEDEALVTAMFAWQSGELAGLRLQGEQDLRALVGAQEILRRYAYRVEMLGGEAIVSRDGGNLNIELR